MLPIARCAVVEPGADPHEGEALLARIIGGAGLSARAADFRPCTGDAGMHDPRRLDRRSLGADL